MHAVRLLACLVMMSTAAASLREVLERAARYTLEYGAALATVLADEEYTQQLVRPGGELRTQRTLRSEFAFVRLAESTEWLAFRNVLHADGVAVAEADRRLSRLFDAAPQSILAQARLIAEQSARYNLGPLRRDFNVPTTALQFVHPSHQHRFRFDKQGEEQIGGERVWILRFREQNRGTLIRTPDGRDVPVQGRLWIVPQDGRVLRTSFLAQDFIPRATSHAELKAAWRLEARLGIWVPAEMHEHYTGPWTADGEPYDIAGRASYTNYRRFDVAGTHYAGVRHSEHLRDVRRAREDPGPRPGAVRARRRDLRQHRHRRRRHGGGRRSRDGGVHGAGPGARPDCRSPRRHLRVRRDSVRDALGAARVPGRVERRHHVGKGRVDGIRGTAGTRETPCR